MLPVQVALGPPASKHQATAFRCPALMSSLKQQRLSESAPRSAEARLTVKSHVANSRLQEGKKRYSLDGGLAWVAVRSLRVNLLYLHLVVELYVDTEQPCGGDDFRLKDWVIKKEMTVRDRTMRGE